MKTGDADIVWLGNPREIVYPHPPNVHPLHADGDDWEVDQEEIEALCRRFKIENLHKDS